MSGSLLRDSFSAMAVAVETTAGVDAIADSPTSAMMVLGSGDFAFNPNVTEDESFSGGLDAIPGTVGGLMPSIRATVPLRGSGAAGTAPAWGPLMRACAFEEVVTATAIGAPTAATAGTATTATLATPFAATAQLYRGMPALLTGNPAGPLLTPILDYTAGRVATFGQVFTPVLSLATLVQIPAHVLYRPTSDRTIHRTATVYLYKDGMVTRFTGCTGTLVAALTSGAAGSLQFALRGQFLSRSVGVPIPAALSAGSPIQAPRWTNGLSRFLGARAQLKTLSVDMGLDVTMPDDPEAAEGYGPGVAVGRAIRVTLDPLTDTTTVLSVVNNFRAGAGGALVAQIGATAGNRFTMGMPALRVLGADDGNRQRLATQQIQAQANAVDAGFFLGCC